MSSARLPAAADLVTDSPPQLAATATDWPRPPQLAAFDPPAVIAADRARSLGAILAGAAQGRTSPDQIALFESVGACRYR